MTSIQEHHIRAHTGRIECACRSKSKCTDDAELINLSGGRHPDAAVRRPRTNTRGQSLPLRCGAVLAVTCASRCRRCAGVNDDNANGHRSGESPSTNLIDRRQQRVRGCRPQQGSLHTQMCRHGESV